MAGQLVRYPQREIRDILRPTSMGHPARKAAIAVMRSDEADRAVAARHAGLDGPRAAPDPKDAPNFGLLDAVDHDRIVARGAARAMAPLSGLVIMDAGVDDDASAIEYELITQRVAM